MFLNTQHKQHKKDKNNVHTQQTNTNKIRIMFLDTTTQTTQTR